MKYKIAHYTMPSTKENSQSLRHTSIVEMLSTPPQLSQLPQLHHSTTNESQNSNNSISSLSVSSLQINNLQDETGIASPPGSISNNSSTVSTATQPVPILSNTNPTGTPAYNKKWQTIKLSQLIEQNKLITIEGSVSVEEAFNTLIKHHLTSLPVKLNANEDTISDFNANWLTFDYNDLNAYLLLVLNKIKVNDAKITRDCQNGQMVSVGDIIRLTPKNPFVKLSEMDDLSTVISILGSGVHRIAIFDDNDQQIKGILSQRRLVKYLWDNARLFEDLQPLFNSSLQDLKISNIEQPSTHHHHHHQTTSPTAESAPSIPNLRRSRIISIQGEQPLIDALYKICLLYTSRCV